MFRNTNSTIAPKIIIEPLMRDEINTPPREIEVYCFRSKPKIFVNVRYSKQREISVYDESFNQIDLIFHPDGNNAVKLEKADDLLNQTFGVISVERCRPTAFQGRKLEVTGNPPEHTKMKSALCSSSEVKARNFLSRRKIKKQLYVI